MFGRQRNDQLAMSRSDRIRQHNQADGSETD
jgi:hypothetical protein